MTLYWGYYVSSDSYSNVFVATTATVGKIENVECIADAADLPNSKGKNHGKFAIIKKNDSYKVIPLGIIKKTKDENGIVFYKGTKVFTNDKKTLLDYYRKGAVKFNNEAEKNAKRYEKLALESKYYEWDAKMCRSSIGTTQKVYKKLIDKIKAL